MPLSDYLLVQNVAGWDLAVRALAGILAIIALVMWSWPYPWNWVLAVIAFVGLYTSIMRHCSLYPLMRRKGKTK